MKEKEYSGNIAFYYRGSWYHRTKKLDEFGKTIYSRQGGFKTPDEAEKSYYENIREYENQVIKFQSPKVNKDILFKDYLVYWYENILSKRVKSTTSMSFSYGVYNLIIPNLLYDVKLIHLTTEYIDAVLEKINKVGQSTAHKARQIINLSLKEACLEKYILNNPVDNAKVYKRNTKEIIILKEAEIKKLLEIVSKDNWYIEILLALFCGLRRGEIMGLKFSDFDLNNNTVRIERQLSTNYIMKENEFKIENLTLYETDPKTENSYRTLKIPQLLIDEIIKRKSMIDLLKTSDSNYIDNDYICCQKNGLPRHGASLTSYLKKICLRNNLPQITIHGLRHMYATILIENNVALPKISTLLGHSSIHTTFGIYCSVMNHNDEIMAYLNNKFGVEELENG